MMNIHRTSYVEEDAVLGIRKDLKKNLAFPKVGRLLVLLAQMKDLAEAIPFRSTFTFTKAKTSTFRKCFCKFQFYIPYRSTNRDGIYIPRSSTIFVQTQSLTTTHLFLHSLLEQLYEQMLPMTEKPNDLSNLIN